MKEGRNKEETKNKKKEARNWAKKERKKFQRNVDIKDAKNRMNERKKFEIKQRD